MRLSREEAGVIEAALYLAEVREASRFGPVGDAIERAGKQLSQAVSALHCAHEGRYPESLLEE